MKAKGGISSNSALHKVVRISASVLSILVAGYTYLFTAGYIDAPLGFIEPTVGYSFAGVWLALGILQYIFYQTTPLNTLIRLASYQLLTFLYLSFVTGIADFLFISWWIIVAMVSYAYYRIPGYIASVIVILLASTAHVIIYSQTLENIESTFAVGFAITAAMTIVVLILRIQERDEAAFIAAQHDETIQRESLLTLVNNLADAVISIDHKGRITLYNAAAINLLDTNLNLQGAQIDEVLKLRTSTDEKVTPSELLRSIDRVTTSEDFHITLGDDHIRLELTYSPIRGPGSAENTYMLIMRDITKAKSLEEERDEFISVVSHELRTPIAITEGAIDNARVIFERDSQKKDSVKQTLTLAHEQVLFLARMVNDLSTLSRAERGVADEAEVIDISELLQLLHTEYSPEAASKNLKLNLKASGSLGSVSASRLYLQELLQNFITNAIKYTKEGHIDLIVHATKSEVTFSVKDTGIGISQTDLKRIFDKFYRSEDYRTRETGGTGLGLYVAMKLSKKLGCKIEVKSRLNHGSTFSFSLPKLKS